MDSSNSTPLVQLSQTTENAQRSEQNRRVKREKTKKKKKAVSENATATPIRWHQMASTTKCKVNVIELSCSLLFASFVCASSWSVPFEQPDASSSNLLFVPRLFVFYRPNIAFATFRLNAVKLNLTRKRTLPSIHLSASMARIAKIEPKHQSTS